MLSNAKQGRGAAHHRRLLVGLLAVLLALTIVLPAAANPIELTLWMPPFAPENRQILVDLVDQFNREQSAIYVELEADTAINEERYLVAIAGGVTPDIGWTSVFPSFYTEGVLAPVQEMAQRDGVAATRFWPGTSKGGSTAFSGATRSKSVPRLSFTTPTDSASRVTTMLPPLGTSSCILRNGCRTPKSASSAFTQAGRSTG